MNITDQTSQGLFYLLVFLGVVILFLSIYLGFVLSKLFKQKKEIKQREELIESKNKEKYLNRVESVRIICLAAIQDQCNLSEACIRVKLLLDLIPDFASANELYVLHQMYDKVRVFDTHENREALSKQEKFKQDSLRFKIEEEYKNEILETFQMLFNRCQKI